MSDYGTDVLPDDGTGGPWAGGQPGPVTRTRVGPDGTDAGIPDPDDAAAAAYRRRSRKGAEYDAELEETNRTTNTIRKVFYVAVLIVALGGQTTGAVEVLDVPWWAALAAVAVLELGGVVIMRIAEVRRRLGESAVFVMLLAFAVGTFATVFNWIAHSNHKAGAFFAFMSGLGFLVWVVSTEHRRRDRLRENGQMSDLPPQYEFVTHWLRHPWITLRARSMAKAKPSLGLTGSLFHAELAMRRDRRLKGISRVLARKIRKAVDPVTASIAINVYDLDRVAVELERQADYVGLTDLIAADLLPSRIAAHQTVKVESIVGNPVGRKVVEEQVASVVQEAIAATLPGQLAAIEAATSAATEHLHAAAIAAANRMAELAAPVAGELAAVSGHDDEEVAEEMAASMAGESDGEQEERNEHDGRQGGQERIWSRPSPTPSGRSDAARKVAAALAKNPNLTTAQLAAKFRIPERTVRRHVAAARSSTGQVNGRDHGVG